MCCYVHNSSSYVKKIVCSIQIRIPPTHSFKVKDVDTMYTANVCRRTSGEEQVVVKIPRRMADKLPLLQDILSSSAPTDDADNDNDNEAGMHGAPSASGDIDNPLQPSKVRKEIPLRLPGSVWALVSLVLVLAGRVNAWQWLGDVQADPLLTQQTLEVCCGLHIPFICLSSASVDLGVLTGFRKCLRSLCWCAVLCWALFVFCF